METSSRATKTARKSRADANKHKPAVGKKGNASNSPFTVSSGPKRVRADIRVTATRQMAKKGLKRADRPSVTKRLDQDAGIGRPDARITQINRRTDSPTAMGPSNRFANWGAMQSTRISPTPANTKRTSGQSHRLMGPPTFQAPVWPDPR